MARAIALFSGLFVIVASGGCIYATGVQDYKVDDNATSGGPPVDDSACFAETTFRPCEICCANHHPVEKFQQLEQLRVCVCTPDRCQPQCSDDGAGNNFCADAHAGFSDLCSQCIDGQVKSGACVPDFSNPYTICQSHCPTA
jgi:hypothetical protein